MARYIVLADTDAVSPEDTRQSDQILHTDSQLNGQGELH
jgi:hypothetical protein